MTSGRPSLRSTRRGSQAAVDAEHARFTAGRAWCKLVVMVSTQSRSRGVWLATAEDLDTVVEVLVDSHVDYAWERWALPRADRPQRLSRLYSAMLRTLALPRVRCG